MIRSIQKTQLSPENAGRRGTSTNGVHDQHHDADKQGKDADAKSDESDAHFCRTVNTYAAGNDAADGTDDPQGYHVVKRYAHEDNGSK